MSSFHIFCENFFAKFYFSEAGGDDDEDESYVHPFQPPKGKIFIATPTYFGLVGFFGSVGVYSN